MSGGSFDYAYQKPQWFADDLEERLNENEPTNKWMPSPQTVEKLRDIVKIARYAARLMKEAEWLYSGDTSDDSFMERVLEIESSNKGEMIGGVLTYEVKSGGRICGNTIGADGSGEFAVVIEGSPDVADQWARDYLRKLDASGVRLGRIVFVSGHETYSGCPIQTVVT